jgi:hypothetical protein
MRLGRQRGRKRILAPDGSELTPPTRPHPDSVLVKALDRAWHWQKLLDKGVYGSVTEIAEAEKISKSYVSRILRLALLAQHLVEAILGAAGRTSGCCSRSWSCRYRRGGTSSGGDWSAGSRTSPRPLMPHALRGG